MQKFSPEYCELHLGHAGEWHLAENVPGADAATYRPLNHCWCVDKDCVYFDGRRLKHADAASFTALNELYAKDKHKVYAKYGNAGAVEDPEAFIAAYKDAEEFADEPSYASILDGIETPDQLEPFRVLQEVFRQRGLLGVIDWRSETHETINQVEPMLRRHGIRDFDWSFIDELLQKGDGTELRNNNFLSLLRDRLRELGLTLAHINLYGDSYAFAVLRSADFAKINGMVDPQAFAVCDDFGPDPAYARAKRLLATP